jgi:hypothetical protein
MNRKIGSFNIVELLRFSINIQHHFTLCALKPYKLKKKNQIRLFFSQFYLTVDGTMTTAYKRRTDDRIIKKNCSIVYNEII